MDVHAYIDGNMVEDLAVLPDEELSTLGSMAYSTSLMIADEMMRRNHEIEDPNLN
jgi:hypothetical protein